jgi:hypothetical protein
LELPGSIQLVRRGQRFVVRGLGDEPLPGWRIQALRVLQRALLADPASGALTEADDHGFLNRAVELELVAADGSVERHLGFIDRPQLTRGTHPQIAPVYRLHGDSASGALLECEAPASRDRLLFMREEDALVSVWLPRHGKAQRVRHTGPLPWQIELGEHRLEVLRDVRRARVEVRAIQATPRAGRAPTPAWVIVAEHGGERQQLQLPLGHRVPWHAGGVMRWVAVVP